MAAASTEDMVRQQRDILWRILFNCLTWWWLRRTGGDR